jgi:hypothetical protein
MVALDVVAAISDEREAAEVIARLVASRDTKDRGHRVRELVDRAGTSGNVIKGRVFERYVNQLLQLQLSLGLPHVSPRLPPLKP